MQSTSTTTIDTEFRFGGFYGFHEHEIENIVEILYLQEEEKEFFDPNIGEKIDYPKTFLEYAKQLHNKVLIPYLKDNLHEILGYKKPFKNLEKKFIFKELYSPNFYNFETDKIILSVDNSFIEKIYKRIMKNFKEDFNDFLLEKATSQSGFTSFFDGGLSNEKWNTPIKWGDGQEDYLLRFLLKDFNILTEMSNYDFSFYDIILKENENNA